jgi:hypothetical protein
MGFFFTKLFYANVLYPPSLPDHPNKAVQEYPSVLAPRFSKNLSSANRTKRLPISTVVQAEMEAFGAKSRLPVRKNTRKCNLQSERCEFDQVFNLDELCDLDLRLFPTAVRSVRAPQNPPSNVVQNSSPAKDEIKPNPASKSSKKSLL